MTPVEQALQILGPLVDTPKPALCPLPDHEDSHASATLYPDGFFCHRCGEGGSPLDFYALSEGLTIRQALVKLGVTTGRPPPPKPKLPASVDTFINAFADKLSDSPEWHLARSWAKDIKRLNIPERTTIQCLTDPTFLDACRHKGLNPLLVHDLLFMEVA